MKILQQFFCILTLITTTHIHSMLELPEDTTTHICSLLTIPELLTLKRTCTLLCTQCDWKKAEFMSSLAKNPATSAFASKKLRHHINTENTDAVLAMISLPIINLINRQDEHGMTPLMVACSCPSGYMLDLLLEHGALIRVPRENRQNIMHHLFANGMSADTLPDKLQRLVEGQEKVMIDNEISLKDSIGWTPLHYLLFRVSSILKDQGYSLDIQTTLDIIAILRKYALKPLNKNYTYGGQSPLDMLKKNIHGTCSSFRCTQEEYDAISHALTDK